MLDNAAAEAFFSSLEWEVLSRHQLADPDHARTAVAALVYDSTTTADGTAALQMLSPIDYELAT